MSKVRGVGNLVAGGMLREGTPIEDYQSRYRLWVKREDLACPHPGPAFSKARGVYARIASRPEKVIGVLDTYHSQAGHAVARACQILGKKCLNFYPEYKYSPGPRPPQYRAKFLGAKLIGLPAGRSAVLYHAAKRLTLEAGGYAMPNALKLEESVTETAREVPSESFQNVLVSISSGTIAAGVIQGFLKRKVKVGRFIIHLGYSRSHDMVLRYLQEQSGFKEIPIDLIDEAYQYKDQATEGETPPWPCDPWYDLKAFCWWLRYQGHFPGKTLFWNIG